MRHFSAAPLFPGQRSDDTLITVTNPVARYTSSRWYSPLALFAFGCALAAGWMAPRWPAEAVPAGFVVAIGVVLVFAILAIGFAALALRPAIEIHETHLLIGRGVNGRRAIPWGEIRRVDQGHWQTHGQTRWQIRWNVLAVYLTLDGGRRLLVIHAGSADSGCSLLRHLRRYAREALLDGIPYRQFWGQGTSERIRSEDVRSESVRPESVNSERTPSRSRLEDSEPLGDTGHAAPPRYPFLLPEDEAEIDHMFERLKAAGRLEPQSHDIQNHDSRGDASLDPRASGEGQG